MDLRLGRLAPSGRCDCDLAVRDRTLSPIWVLSSTVTLPGAVYASGCPAEAFYARLDAHNITLDGFTETGGGLFALN